MKSNFRVILAVECLTLATLACAALTGGGGNRPTSAPIGTDVPVLPTESLSTTGDVLLIDDFSSAQWGTGTDANRSVEYASEALQMIVFSKNYFVWSPRDDEDYQNVHMEVTVINNDTDPTTAFGLICNRQVREDSSFYYFAMTPAGEYAIAKAQVGQTDVFLTNNDEWASSDLISKDAPSYRVGADCGHGNLTLYVDGQQIASVSDSSYTSGGIAVFTWSGEEVASANVSFDDFAMTELP
jgi:hypothetical protein